MLQFSGRKLQGAGWELPADGGGKLENQGGEGGSSGVSQVVWSTNVPLFVHCPTAVEIAKKQNHTQRQLAKPYFMAMG